MVKKVKSSAADKGDGSQLAAAIKESAQQIWLAGLGAFAKAQEEGSKVFEALVKEGSSIQQRSKAFTEEKLGEVGGMVSQVANDVAKQATHSWDKLEQVFEERVARSLKRLGVPTNRDVQDLIKRVEELNKNVQALGGKALGGARKPRAPRAAAAATKKKAPAKRVARKASE